MDLYLELMIITVMYFIDFFIARVIASLIDIKEVSWYSYMFQDNITINVKYIILTILLIISLIIYYYLKTKHSS